MLIRVRMQRMAMGDPGFGGFGKWFGKAVSRTIHGKAFRNIVKPVVSMIPGVGPIAGTLLGAVSSSDSPPLAGFPGFAAFPGGVGLDPGFGGGSSRGRGGGASFAGGSALVGPRGGKHRKMTPEERKARGLKPHLSMSWSNSRALARSQRRLGMFIHHFTRTARFLGMHVGRAPHRSKRGAFPRRKR